MYQAILAKDIMATRLVTLRPTMDVFEAMSLLLRNRVSGAPVVDEDGRFLGVFSEKVCMSVLIDAAYDSLPTNEVGVFLDPNIRTVDEEIEILTIAQVFLLTDCRQVPVLRGEKLVGMISRRDVIRATLDALEHIPQRESTLLYLSALRELHEAPTM